MPVLLHEVLAALDLRPGGRYIDGTFGGGGHTRAILERTGPDGHVTVFDRDPQAIDRAQLLASELPFRGRMTIERASFTEMRSIAEASGLHEVDGILLDLGISSYQLDDPHRGFAFSHDGPLDMRFDTTTGLSAADLINTLTADELARIIWQFGEDRHSRRIAAAIIKARQRAVIDTTSRLAEIVEQAVGGRRGSAIHPATRTFQALRIAVNQELEALAIVLPEAASLLAPGGRLVVIAFHSLEDRIVKQFLRRESASCLCPPEQPVCTCSHIPTLAVAGKAVRPGPAEIARNPRSRSAVMRVATRLTPVARDAA